MPLYNTLKHFTRDVVNLVSLHLQHPNTIDLIFVLQEKASYHRAHSLLHFKSFHKYI